MDSILIINKKYNNSHIFDIETNGDYNIKLKASKIDEKWVNSGKTFLTIKEVKDNVIIEFSSKKKIKLDYGQLEELFVALSEIHKDISLHKISY